MSSRAIVASARLAGGALMRAQSDERLVDLVRAGNDAAFEAIVARYRRPLLRYCAAVLSEARADDAVQQSFLRAYDALRASDRPMALRPWLFRIAHNVSLNALRDAGLGHEELPATLDGVARPDQVFERTQRLRELLDAVAALPEHQRDAIVLRELEGRSHADIAAQLGVSDGAVRQLLHRARTTLRTAASAIVPPGAFDRLPWQGSDASVTARVAELCGAGAAAGTGVLAKLSATALVTGAVIGGAAAIPAGSTDTARQPPPARAAGGPLPQREATGQERETVRRATTTAGLTAGRKQAASAQPGTATDADRTPSSATTTSGARAERRPAAAETSEAARPQRAGTSERGDEDSDIERVSAVGGDDEHAGSGTSDAYAAKPVPAESHDEDSPAPAHVEQPESREQRSEEPEPFNDDDRDGDR